MTKFSSFCRLDVCIGVYKPSSCELVHYREGIKRIRKCMGFSTLYPASDSSHLQLPSLKLCNPMQYHCTQLSSSEAYYLPYAQSYLKLHVLFLCRCLDYHCRFLLLVKQIEIWLPNTQFLTT